MFKARPYHQRNVDISILEGSREYLLWLAIYQQDVAGTGCMRASTLKEQYGTNRYAYAKKRGIQAGHIWIQKHKGVEFIHYRSQPKVLNQAGIQRKDLCMVDIAKLSPDELITLAPKVLAVSALTTQLQARGKHMCGKKAVPQQAEKFERHALTFINTLGSRATIKLDANMPCYGASQYTLANRSLYSRGTIRRRLTGFTKLHVLSVVNVADPTFRTRFDYRARRHGPSGTLYEQLPNFYTQTAEYSSSRRMSNRMKKLSCSL